MCIYIPFDKNVPTIRWPIISVQIFNFWVYWVWQSFIQWGLLSAHLKFWRLTDPFNSKVASSEKQIQLKNWFPSPHHFFTKLNSSVKIIFRQFLNESYFIRVVIMFFQNFHDWSLAYIAFLFSKEAYDDFR